MRSFKRENEKHETEIRSIANDALQKVTVLTKGKPSLERGKECWTTT